MTMFNSLAYATKLVNAGLPRAQAEVHAQELQEVLERECGQYATKADLIALGSEVKAEIKQLEEKTDRLEAKTGRLEAKIDGCIAEFAGLRADVTVLTSSHKFVLWIGGGVATMCLSVFGLMVTTLWPSLK
jgi:predicted nuclease with TOPRIM domain